MPSNKTWTLLLLSSIQFLYVMDFMIIMPLGTYLMTEWSINAAQFGWLISGFAIAGGIAALLATLFIDRYDKRAMLCLIFSLFTLGVWATAFAPTYFLMLTARIFTGTFGGLLGALILSDIGDQYRYSERSKAISFTTIGLALASVIGVPTGIYMASALGWRAAFILLGALSTIATILLYTVLRPQQVKVINPPASIAFWSTFAQFIKIPAPRMGLLFSIAIVFSQYAIFIYLAPYLIQNAGLAEEDLTYIYLVGGVSTILAAPLIGFLADRFGKKKLFLLLSLLLIAPIIAITMLPPPSFWQILGIAVFYFAFDAGRMIPINTMLTELVDSDKRSSYLSLRSAIKKLATGLIGLLGGWIVQTNVDGTLRFFEIMGFIAIFSLVVSILLVYRTPLQNQENDPKVLS